jgi:hypothetical protein
MLAAATTVIGGDLEATAKLVGAYEVLSKPLGDFATPIKTLGLPDPAVQARKGLGDEAYERARATGAAMTPDEVAALLTD